MKAIRRSLKGDKESKPHHISVTPKSAFAIEPPKKVIKALYDYTPEPGTPHELAFAKGDFFHVIGREDDPDWYDACNPLIPSARGLVPVTFFEVIGKNERSSAGSAHGQNPYGFPATGGSDYGHHQHLHNLHDSGYAGVGSGLGTGIAGGGSSSNSCSSMARGGAALIYGIVLYDFSAERPDELEATAGEAIIVIAVSNPEWFVAKPIGRLGGPGLIPVSFIEIRDMSSGAIVTDPADAVRRAGVPRVEEWKKMTADYKNSSITLGKFEQQQQHQQQHQQQRAHQQQQLLLQQQQQHKKQQLEQQLEQRYQAERLASDMDRLSVGSPTSSAALAPVRASIPRYCFDQDRYWYIIEAEMEDGRHWELSRFYEDFYNFQIGLLREFEEEAGNRSKPRTLPFMPGPVNTVTDAISNGRRQNLDEYIRKVIAMPPHISRSQLVRQLFAPRPGDFEIDPTVTADDFGGSGGGTDRRSYESTGSYRGGDGHYRGLSGSSQSAGVAAAVPVIPPIARQPAAPAPMMPAYVSPPATAAARPVVGGGGSGGSGGVAPLPPPASSTPTPPIKIKVYYRDDLIALRVPADTTFAALVQKVRERLHVDDASGGDRLVLRYRDEPSGGQLVLLGSDTDLDEALRRNAKLGLYVGFE